MLIRKLKHKTKVCAKLKSKSKKSPTAHSQNVGIHFRRPMKYIIYIIIFACFLSCKAQKTESKVEIFDTSKFEHPELISDFISAEWEKVFKAKDSLLNIGESVIPDLLKLMDNPKAFQKLQNTADLIYPGATEFWGHGWVIDYDLDWIAIRAGWAMENLTSQHFGFTENVITEKELMDLHKKDYAIYIETGIHNVNFKRQKFKELDAIIKKAENWWKNNQDNWTPLSGLKDAIFSNDINRQLDAIQQMRFTRFKIKGYNQEWFEREIKARIIELNKTDDEELKLQTKYLLR